MGVTGLWTVVSPTARPTKLETLNRKRLAVDASIWIYQFLKAVRDKEGNALRNSHVVGFFRRICKLLYFGIKPVFVFDGGAPVLKRETVRGRARRREGRREDAVKTAGKLLSLQVARQAEEEEKRRKQAEHGGRRPAEEEILPDDQELVYVDEIGMGQKERQAGRGFKRKDQYHLPDLDVSIESLGAPNDPRIMSQAELEEYARQFHSGEDINLYDFSKIDFESPFFLSLPAGDRYNILNAARLRSRLRMGYSKEQLDGMFPDRMAFSRFQIERVKERNDLTQRLMHINGMSEDAWDQGGRIVGEKGKEYVLVKNDGVEGGWALGVVSNKQGEKKEDAIDLEQEEDDEDFIRPSDEEEDFEDVAIEGLNRIPKTWQRKKKEMREVDYDVSYEDAAAQIARKRKAVYEGRRQAAQKAQAPTSQKPEQLQQNGSIVETTATSGTNDLFIPENKNGDASDEDDLFEDVDIGQFENDDDDELQKAIAMSLEQPNDEDAAGGFLPETAPAEDKADDSDDSMDLAAAMAEARKSKYQSKTNVRKSSPIAQQAQPSEFSGPLPFESLNLGQSLLGKKKAKQVEEGLSGGFDRDAGPDGTKKKKAQPLPDWFNTAPTTTDMREPESDSDDHITYGREDVDRRETLMRHRTKEIIDLEADDDADDGGNVEIIEAEEEENNDQTPQEEAVGGKTEAHDQESEPIEETEEQIEKRKAGEEREKRYKLAMDIAAENENEKMLMDDVAEEAQANPPAPKDISHSIPNHQPSPARQTDDAKTDTSESVDWSESDEEPDRDRQALSSNDEPSGGHLDSTKSNKSDTQLQPDYDEGEDFEDVNMGEAAPLKPTFIVPRPENVTSTEDNLQQPDYLIEDQTAVEEGTTNQVSYDNYLSDSDEELMRQLAIEAEEHARFASSLNNTRTPAQEARDYENELKQLRNQQKKDRRDADEVTQVMIQECQALLRLFGLPYITAPMEAEAQCAELVHLGLVDGIVTDDSDIFLFGGTRIYKNMFNAQKFVECYLSSDLEKEYDLDRKKLIRFAHLLGSDYTEGIPGIGPVTALEIISDFGSLQEFREWCSKVQLGRPQDLDGQLTTPFRRKFKKTVQKKLFLPNSFPDVRVDKAYLQPEVDSSPDEFQWGIPDLDKLRSFLMTTIGWSQERMDEILVPVIRDINKRGVEGTQANITRFFSGGVGVGAIGSAGGASEGTAPRNRMGKESGRMKTAYTRLRGEARKKRFGDEVDGEGSGDLGGGDDGDGVVNGGGDDDKATAMSGVERNQGDEQMSTSSTAKPKQRTKPKGTKKKRKTTSVAVGDDDGNDNYGDEHDLSGDESDFKPKKKVKKSNGKEKE